MITWEKLSNLSQPLLPEGFDQPFSLYSSLLTSPPSQYGPSQLPFSSGAHAPGAKGTPFKQLEEDGDLILSTPASSSIPSSASVSSTPVAPHAVPGSDLPEWKENVECEDCSGPIVVAFPACGGICRQCADKRCLVGTCVHSWHQIAPSPIPFWRSQLATDFLNRQAERTKFEFELTHDPTTNSMSGKYTLHIPPLVPARKLKPAKPQRKRSLIGTFLSEKSS